MAKNIKVRFTHNIAVEDGETPQSLLARILDGTVMFSAADSIEVLDEKNVVLATEENI